MGSTVGSRVVTGGLTATNADIEVRTVGFCPSLVKVENMDNQVMIEWKEPLAAGRNIKTDAAGARTVVASGGIEMLAPDSDGNRGFKIPGALADINDTTTEELIWTASESW